MKIRFINLFLCITLLFSTSCVTKMIWGDEHYQEEISKFLIGADGRYVALIGKNYHYVFSDNSGMLKEVLSLNQKGVLTLNRQETFLKLESNNDITGSIVIHGPFNILSPHDKEVLFRLGFGPDKNYDVTVKVDLVGKRYLSKYLGHNSEQDTGSHYSIKVYYRNKSNLIKDAGKAAITPIAATIDATLFIGKVLVYPFSL